VAVSMLLPTAVDLRVQRGQCLSSEEIMHVQARFSIDNNFRHGLP
jgi:hypothetical protein